MKKKLELVTFVAFAALLVSACEEEPNRTEMEAAEDAMREHLEQWETAFHSSDLEQIMSLYAPDAVRMPPNEAAQEGSHAIRSAFEQFFSEYASEGRINIQAGMISGDLHYVRGTYTGTSTSKARGDPIHHDNKFVVVLQRRPDGSWKTLCEIWNENPSPSKGTT